MSSASINNPPLFAGAGADAAAASDSQQPLADSLRPSALQDIVGQPHLLAADAPLTQILNQQAPLHSMILWGPPGCGKTTLARAMTCQTGARAFYISAVTAGIADVRQVIEQARQSRASEPARARVLFIDEAHHFNKSQQDAFLPHVESGLFIFIGATTQNPSFEINNALLSRVSVYRLQPLSDDDLHRILENARTKVGVSISETAAAMLVNFADGDARRLLNAFEKSLIKDDSGGARAKNSDEAKSKPNTITEEVVGRLLGDRHRQFDNHGDWFYDQISALHKSIRGSDPDAALYWYCRMADGGVDLRYVARRLIRAADEDIGLADPRALTAALNADAAYRRLGSPEGELSLANAVLYLACAPKSNAGYLAHRKMARLVGRDASHPVPLHLRNAPTKLMKAQGFGKDYRNPHDYPAHYIADENYFPDTMAPVRVYAPSPRGLEEKIKAKLERLRQQH